VYLIGSDAHNDKNRNFFLKSALEQVAKKTDAEFSKKLIQNAYKVLKGEKIEPDFIEAEFKKTKLLEKIKSKIWN